MPSCKPLFRLAPLALAAHLLIAGPAAAQPAPGTQGPLMPAPNAALSEQIEQRARAAGGGVTRVANGAVALQAVDDVLLGEGVADQADMAFDMKLGAVIGDDAGRFLAAMLQRMQAKRDDGRGVLPAENAEHTAFVVEIVVGLGGKHVVCVCHLKLR